MEEGATDVLKKVVIQSKLSNFKNDPWLTLWFERLTQYIVLFGIVVIPGMLLINWYSLSPLNIDNARYLLSAMVQAQAAIISLVITLTLIAIQIAASSYTSRVIDVMKKNPDLWLLLYIYVLSISIGFLALNQLAITDKLFVTFILVFGIYTFFTLFLYMVNTIKLLNPDEIVTMLVAEIYSGNIHQKEWKDDIMQPVFDVVHASINRYDVTTTRTGLNKLSLKILELSPDFNEIAKSDITRHFCKHIQRSSLIALGNEDEGTLEEILTILEKLEIGICENEDSSAVFFPIISVMQFIGVRATDKGLEGAIRNVAHALETVGMNAADKGRVFDTQLVLNILKKVGLLAANNEFSIATESIANALEKIGKHSADKKIMNETRLAICFLEDIGKCAIENGLEDATHEVAGALSRISIHSSDSGLNRESDMAVYSFRTVCELDVSKKHESGYAINGFENIGINALDKGLKNQVNIIIHSLGTIGAISVDQNLKADTKYILEVLSSLGIEATKMGRGEEFKMVVEVFEKIGYSSKMKGFKDDDFKVIYDLCQYCMNSNNMDDIARKFQLLLDKFEKSFLNIGSVDVLIDY